MNRVFYAEQPDKVGYVDGLAIYRWDIQKEESGYSCLEVSFAGAVTREKVTEKVIEAVYGHGYEQKILNDFNAAAAGILSPEYKQPYLDFLNDRKTLKAEIHEAIQ